ncbi:MAG: TonB-dependent receptor [Acidobacteria bacterium]|nr:TonB-dependent receptor [Acidobacteriota bacterium]
MKFLLAVFLAGVALCAQSAAGGGTIQGTVLDSTGAVVAGAKVDIRHIDTGLSTVRTANSDGYFTTPPLNIGRYRIRVEHPGMKVWEGELQLETGKTVQIEPLLSAGAVTETVQVTDAIPLVTTADPTDASTLDSRRIKELPINGRDLNTLLGQVAPGVEQIIDVNGGVRTGGLMGYSNSYVQDGAASNNREFGGSMNLQGLESVGEVRVETSTSSAKYNTPTSVIVSTKSGTNKLHFSAYETARNNAFGVARARQDISFSDMPYSTPKLIRNEFGGSISGPIAIPRLYNGRNRSFFFFSREGVELRQGLTRDFSVPTVAMRNGDFSDLVDSLGRKLTLYDPLTTRSMTLENGRVVSVRDPFRNNIIPAGRISPLAKYIYGVTPLPTDNANPLVTTNLKMAVATNGNPNLSDNPTTIRVDHTLSENSRFFHGDRVFLKVNGGRRRTNFIGTAGGIGAPTAHSEANVTFLPMQAIAAALSWNHSFSSRLFVENLVAQTWQSTKTITGPSDAQADFAKKFNLPNPYGEIGFPNITNVGFMTYTEGDNRRALTSRILSVQQNYSYLQKTHNIQFGWSLFSEKQHLLPDQGGISGTSYYNSLATALESPALGSSANPQAVPQTGYDAANFFLGYAARYDVGLKRSYLRLTNRTYGMYLQDNYKVSNRLTLTPGIRWDVNPAMREENSQLNRFDVPSHSLLFPKPLEYYYNLGSTTPQIVDVFRKVGVTFNSAADLKQNPEIFPSNYFDIGPRMGFAYKAFEGNKTLVIRGGYGLYISAIPMRTLLAQFSGLAPFRATFSYNPNSAATSPDLISNYLLRTTPTIVAGENSANVIDITNPNSVGRGISVVGVEPRFPNLRVHEFNLAVEKQFTPSFVFRLRYNGKHGTNADQLNEINPAPTSYVWYSTTGLPLQQGAFASVANRPYDQNAYTSVRLLAKTGFINAQTFTVEGERRFTNGLGFQAFYTLTNAYRAAGNSFRDGIGNVPEAFLDGAVPKDFDERNRFLNYARDAGVPKHRWRWNFNYNLPFGKGRRFARSNNRLLNGLAGGWKIAGSGTIVSSWYALPTNQWGAINDVEVYRNKYPILDCRNTSATATKVSEERCFEGYLWFNGYLSQRQINSTNAAGLRNGVYGLPADYKPLQSPVRPWPVNGQTTDPGANLYDTNNVNIRLQNGSTVQVAVDTGLHPLRNQFRLGPFNWTQDVSMLKFFNLTERLSLRANIDVFNVFNTQGLNVPGADGVASLRNSYGGFGFRPRQVQVNLRLEW